MSMACMGVREGGHGPTRRSFPDGWRRGPVFPAPSIRETRVARPACPGGRREPDRTRCFRDLPAAAPRSRCAACWSSRATERHAGGDHHGVAAARHALGQGDVEGGRADLVDVRQLLVDHRIHAPGYGQSPRGAQVRGQAEDRRLGPLAGGAQGRVARLGVVHQHRHREDPADPADRAADRIGDGSVGLRTVDLELDVVVRLGLHLADDLRHHLYRLARVLSEAVSAESITASAPAPTAVATSVTSARVGAGRSASTRASGWPPPPACRAGGRPGRCVSGCPARSPPAPLRRGRRAPP